MGLEPTRPALYVNGRVFHLDRDKEQELLALEQGFPGRPLVRFFLMDFATSAANYVGWVRGVLGEAKRRDALREAPVLGTEALDSEAPE